MDGGWSKISSVAALIIYRRRQKTTIESKDIKAFVIIGLYNFQVSVFVDATCSERLLTNRIDDELKWGKSFPRWYYRIAKKSYENDCEIWKQ